MKSLIQKLQRNYPDFTFAEGETFKWSPATKVITYTLTSKETDGWSLLHEVSHAILGHTDYGSDMELLQKEAQAWSHAQQLQDLYNAHIDAEYVEDCLDSYRDWLYKRSTCPTCNLQGVQDSSGRYKCLNCDTGWNVTTERFCRPYRRSGK